MKQSTNNRLSDQEFKQILFQKLNEGEQSAHRKTSFFKLLQSDYKIDKSRSLRLHESYYSEWARLQEEAIERTTIAQTVQQTTNLLQTKAGKIDWYINQIHEIERQLRGDVSTTFIIHSKVYPSHDSAKRFTMPIQIQDLLRRTIKDYISELSRLQGEYVHKISQTDNEGKDVVQRLDLSKVPTELLRSLLTYITTPSQ